LQQDFLKAIEGKEDESKLMDAAHSIAEVGTKYGYDFTPQEAAETYKAAGWMSKAENFQRRRWS
jgi:hypothetical protein